MGLTLPTYSYKPEEQYKAKVFTNAYVWFCSGAQQLDTQPFSMCISGRIYASKEDYQAGYPPLAFINRTYDTQQDIGSIVYGHYDPAWIVPTAMDPITKQEGPLLGLKKETAYLVRHDVDLGQEEAVWD